MTGKRRNEVDIIATKGDIVKDIFADIISHEIHYETGIACSKRENTEIRVNIIKLEQLVKEFDLNNPSKEFPLYDMKTGSARRITLGTEKLQTASFIKGELESKRNAKLEYKRTYNEQYNKKKKRK